MNSPNRLAALSLVLALVCAGASTAQPRWQLKVTPGEPGVVAVFDVLNQGTNYWYFPFSVTNPGPEARQVILTVKALTDTRRTYLSGFYPEAKQRVERVLGRKFRGMSELRGEINPGETWEGVALFRSVDPVMDAITFQVRGIEDPVVRIKGVSYYEVRALEFTYKQLGDEYFPWEDPIEYVGRKWTVLEQRTRVKRS
ncbi:MAG: hypothetical protein JXQ29_12825 [Planctomycetes bacterium]|nr:hypothetical protein [Planctomycetota bacterium]